MDDMYEEAIVEFFQHYLLQIKILTFPGSSPLIWDLENLYQAGGVTLTPCAYQFYIFSIHNFFNRIQKGQKI